MYAVAIQDPSEELSAIRKQLKVTLKEFAAMLNIKASRYKMYEYGYSKKVPNEVVAAARKLLQSVTSRPPQSISEAPSVPYDVAKRVNKLLDAMVEPGVPDSVRLQLKDVVSDELGLDREPE